MFLWGSGPSPWEVLLIMFIILVVAGVQALLRILPLLIFFVVIGFVLIFAFVVYSDSIETHNNEAKVRKWILIILNIVAALLICFLIWTQFRKLIILYVIVAITIIINYFIAEAQNFIIAVVIELLFWGSIGCWGLGIRENTVFVTSDNNIILATIKEDNITGYSTKSYNFEYGSAGRYLERTEKPDETVIFKKNDAFPCAYDYSGSDYVIVGFIYDPLEHFYKTYYVDKKMVNLFGVDNPVATQQRKELLIKKSVFPAFMYKWGEILYHKFPFGLTEIKTDD